MLLHDDFHSFFFFVNKFVELAQEVCYKIQRDGHWVDFIDPSSGRPVISFFFFKN